MGIFPAWLSSDPRSHRDGKKERGSFAGFRFYPDPAAITFGDSLADRQPYSGSRIFFLRVEAFENAENQIFILRRDSDSVIRDTEFAKSIFAIRRYMHPQRLRAAILDCIAKQVL